MALKAWPGGGRFRVMTPEQGASYKRIVQPGTALGVICGVVVILTDVMGA